MRVKDNLLVIRMNVAGLTQWGSSWPRERVYGRGVDSRELWKSVEKSKAEGGQQLKVEKTFCQHLRKSLKPRKRSSRIRMGQKQVLSRVPELNPEMTCRT